MDIPLDEVIFFDAITSTPSTGAAVDADSTPTFAVYEESTDTDIGVGGNLTKRTSLTGNYRGTFTLSAANGFEVGKWYSVIGSAVVGGVTGKAVLKGFRVVAAEAIVGKPKVDVDALLGTAWLAPGVAGTPDMNAKLVAGVAPPGNFGVLSISGLGKINGVVLVDSMTDKLGFRLSAAGVDDVFDEVASGHGTPGTTGKALIDASTGAGGASQTSVDAIATTIGVAGAGLTAIPGISTIRSNTAQAGGSSTITLDAGASSVNEFYDGLLVYLTGGTGAGQCRMIYSYQGSTKLASVRHNWTTAPDVTTTFALLPNSAVPAVQPPSVESIAVYGSVSGSIDGGIGGDVGGRVLGNSSEAFVGVGVQSNAIQWAGVPIAATSIPVATAAGAAGGLILNGAANSGTTTLAALTISGALTTGSNAVPWNVAWDAEVQSECTDSLVAYAAATQTDVMSISNNTRVRSTIPQWIERPDSGSETPTFVIELYDTSGNMEAPDSTPTIALVDTAGADISSRLSVLSNPSTGRYTFTYTNAVGNALEIIRWTVTVVEGGATRTYSYLTSIVDTTAVDFTSADRTKLNTLHDTRIPGVIQPQTGDAFARLGVDGAGLTDLGGMSTAMKSQVQTEAEDALVAKKVDLLAGADAAYAAIAAGSLFAELLENNAGIVRYTAAALINGPSGSSTTAGAGSQTVDITIKDTASNPIDGVSVWITTDVAGTNTLVGTHVSNSSGVVPSFFINPGTYYRFAKLGGRNFVNPQTIVIAATPLVQAFVYTDGSTATGSGGITAVDRKVGYDRTEPGHSTPLSVVRGSRCVVRRSCRAVNRDTRAESIVDISGGQASAIVWSMLPDLEQGSTAILTKTLAATDITLPFAGGDGIYEFVLDDSDTVNLTPGTYKAMLAIVVGTNTFKFQSYDVTIGASA